MRKNPTLLNMILVLLIIAGVCSAAVSTLYSKTEPIIKKASIQKKVETLKKVLPEFNNSPVEEMTKVFVDGDSIEVYTAKKDSVITGYAVSASTTKGYGGKSGKMIVLAGFLPDGTIFNTEVIEIHETPGLGDKADKAKSNWAEQFNQKNPATYNLKVKKDGGDVDAITAATITSRAYCDVLKKAYKAYQTVTGKVEAESESEHDANSGATSQSTESNKQSESDNDNDDDDDDDDEQHEHHGHHGHTGETSHQK